MPGSSSAPLPWRRIAVLAVLAGLAAIIYPVTVVRTGSLLTLILASSDMPPGPIVQQDFPTEQLDGGFGHDGQYFYIAAREPLDPAGAADGLDRPRYRLQRVLFPLLAWLLHPGPGRGLIIAMVVVGLAAIALGSGATAALLGILGGRWDRGWLFAALPGAYWSMRLTTSDTLALGLAIAAVAASLRGRHGWAVVAGTLAVLTKEPIWLVLAGVAVWRRDRAGLALAAVPGAAAAAWFVALRLLVEDTSQHVIEFTWPFYGWYDAWQAAYSKGEVLEGALLLVLITGCGLAALRRHGMRSPLSWPIALHLGLFVVMTASVIGLPDNNSRTMGPLLLLAIVAVLVPPAKSRSDELAAHGVVPATSLAELLRRATGGRVPRA